MAIQKEAIMAITGSYGFTNNTDATHDITPILIVTATDYAVTTDEAGKCVIKNITSPIDQVEVITFQGSDWPSAVKQTETNAHPASVQSSRSCNVKVEMKKRLTSSVDDTFVVDLPITCDISFRFIKNQYITKNDLLMALRRAVGALFDSDDSGNTRLDNMMMMQFNPNK
jgi:hypothetical protein